MKTQNGIFNVGKSQTWLVIFITVLITITLAASMTPLYLGTIEGWTPDKPQFFVQYCGVFINSISLATVAITLVFQHKQMKLQGEQLDQLNTSNNHNFKMAEDTYDSLVLGLIRELQSESTEQMRKKASLFREYLRTDIEKKELERIFEYVILDSWGNMEEYKKILEDETYQQFHAFTALSRLFDTISYYEFNEATIKAIHFYYVWWRESFLIYNQVYYDVHKRTKNKYFTFVPNWITMTDRMDDKMKKFNLPLI